MNRFLHCWRFVLAWLLASTAAHAEDFQGSTQELPYEQEVIFYSKAVPSDPVAQLQKKIDSGELKMKWDEKFGWLPALLDALQVPKSSQMLVFSKTSLQRRLIAPRTPRSLFYNDDVYLGYIPDAPVMEVSVADPKLGGVFYKIAQEKTDKPKLERDMDCLSCHGSGRNLRSVPRLSAPSRAWALGGTSRFWCSSLKKKKSFCLSVLKTFGM